MKTLLKLEEAAMFALTIYLFSWLDYAWWWYPVLFFTPDLSMLAYLAGTKAGAWAYNFVHHKALGLGVLAVGMALTSQPLQLAGLILFGHSSLDRVLGYGLKYPDSFQHTHLEMIGKQR